MEKKKRKRKKNLYWTEETEQAIIEYNKSDDDLYKEKLFKEKLNYPLNKLAENIINRFKFPYMNESFEDVKTEVDPTRTDGPQEDATSNRTREAKADEIPAKQDANVGEGEKAKTVEVDSPDASDGASREEEPKPESEKTEEPVPEPEKAGDKPEESEKDKKGSKSPT